MRKQQVRGPNWSLVVAAVAALSVAGAKAQTAPETVAMPKPPGSVLLNHPIVVDTGHLRSGSTDITLFGIKGEAGPAAEGLQAFITANGDRVTCHPHSAGGDVCVMPTGLDVAATALANGAAQTIADASADYRAQEAGAQAAHLGIWAALPPAPVVVQNPVVQTTAEIVGDGQVFLLAGLVGFPAQFYTMQLQNYIAAHGNRLTCAVQPGGSGAVCLLPDGTDIAQVALRNGLARVGPGASAAYVADQSRAVAAKSGFWFNPPQQVLASLPVQTVQPCCVLDPNDTLDALNYDDGVPTTVIDDQPVFLLYGGLLGWGFFDAQQHWHPAPEAIRARLQQAHPDGRGLRVPAAAGVPGAVAAFRAPGTYGTANFHGPLVFNGPPPLVTSRGAGGFRDVGPLPTPGVFRGTGEGLAAEAAIGGIRGIGPVGAVPHAAFGRVGGNFATVPFHRPIYEPRITGAYRGITPVPHIIAPSPAFLGRR